MKKVRKGKGTSKPEATKAKSTGRKRAELPSKRIVKVTTKHITAHSRSAGQRKQVKRDSR